MMLYGITAGLPSFCDAIVYSPFKQMMPGIFSLCLIILVE